MLTNTKRKHRWTFAARFREGAFGWRSQPAIARIQEALSEIKKESRKDPILGAEGAVLLLEKLSPALMHVDSSSGAIGQTVYNAIDLLAQIIVDAPADNAQRDAWLERLSQAVEKDDIPYLEHVPDHWGDLCATSERASRHADEFLPIMRIVWGPDRKSLEYFKWISACLWLTLYELLKFAEAFKMLSIISSAVRKQKVTQKDWDLLGPYLPMYSPEDRMHPKFVRLNPANPNTDHKEIVRNTIGIAFARFADFINLELSRINLFMPRYDIFGFSPYSESEWSAAVEDIQTTGNFFPGIRMNFPDSKSILWHWFATTTLGKSDLAICADCAQFFTRRSTGRPAKFCSRRCEKRTSTTSLLSP